ncbi:hypothetical protein [Pseudoalteromonas luteoviolacea]|uniref:hypothetical protein n=1 Tax=Pseudoalteromonas luteoviolacea TaxID=43657 RepID=UPI001B35B9F2|nr:hypothetical protein [Pseudoalteromonas luteoviolacea]MBQ4839784.1 hypothetical protein [Pseudoalteromonas luteoviolacea]
MLIDKANSIFSNTDTAEFDIRTARRSIKIGDIVKVYRNLNRPAFHSLMAAEGPFKGKVVGYAKSVELHDAFFKVSKASQQRAVRESRRNVHAFCIGTLCMASDILVPELSGKVVTYNPFFEAYFFDRETKTPVIEGVEHCLIQGANVHIM